MQSVPWVSSSRAPGKRQAGVRYMGAAPCPPQDIVLPLTVMATLTQQARASFWLFLQIEPTYDYHSRGCNTDAKGDPTSWVRTWEGTVSEHKEGTREEGYKRGWEGHRGEDKESIKVSRGKIAWERGHILLRVHRSLRHAAAFTSATFKFGLWLKFG